MAIDIPRLVAACDAQLVRKLIGKIAPDQDTRIDWQLDPRPLGQAVQAAISQDARAWVKLQQIAGLAQHGNRPIIQSVLYHNSALLDEFDELDGGLETAAVWLVLQADELFEHCLSALHVDHGLNKRSWKAFRVRLDKGAKLSFDRERRARFEGLVRDGIRSCPSFDAPGELETHHFRRILFPANSHSQRALEQVTVFAEARMVTEDVFEARVQTRVRRKVDSISVIFDRARGELDVVTIGGKAFIKEVADAFFAAFSNDSPLLAPLIRRRVNFETLLRKPNLVLTDKSRFNRAKIDEIRVRSPTGGLYTFDAKRRRDSDDDVYEIAKRDFGDRNPFEQLGWTVVSARIILFAVPSKPHLRPKMRAIDLKSNGHTNLREQDDTDLYIADELLTRWGLLEPHREESDED